MENEIFYPLYAGLLIIVVAVLIKYAKLYWLIAGYNTMSKEKKEKTDIKGLANMMGNVLLLLGVLLLIVFPLGYYELLDHGSIEIISPVIVLCAVVYLIFQARKFKKPDNPAT